MIKSQLKIAPKRTFLQQVQNAIPLLLESLPEIKQAREELEMKKQRSQLITAMRGLQVIKRAVTLASGPERLEFLQLEKYLDLIVLALRLDIDTSQQEAQRVQNIALDILSSHQLDQPSADHVVLIHENLLPSLHQFFIRSILKRQFSTTAKIMQFLYDFCFSNYNPKVLTYDSHCIYIFQNILNVQESDYKNYEYEVQQCMKYCVQSIHRIASIDELQLPLQHLYGDLLIQVIEANILSDDLILEICEVLRLLFCQDNGVFEKEIIQLQHLVTLIQDIDSVQIQQYTQHFNNLVNINQLIDDEQ